MSLLHRALLTSLPKVALSRACGALTSMPLPARCREPLYRWFARRYGAELGDLTAPLGSFRSLQEFFRRSLRAEARPLGSSRLLWPCDGRIVTAGPVADGRIEQVKGRTYSLVDLLGDAELAKALEGGSQATIYLAPGDYHRVHSPWQGRVETVRALPGTLFPVNPAAVRSIRDLFVRNSRHVFVMALADGTPGAVVMVGAYNVGGTLVTVPQGDVRAGDEIGQFGFGSTVVAIVGRGTTRFPELPAEHRVRMGADAAPAG